MKYPINQTKQTKRYIFKIDHDREDQIDAMDHPMLITPSDISPLSYLYDSMNINTQDVNMQNCNDNVNVNDNCKELSNKLHPKIDNNIPTAYPYTCSRCNLNYSLHADFDRHMKTHLKQLYHCASCNITVGTADELETHYNKIHTYICRQCKYRYSSEEQYIEHKLKHIKKIPMSHFYLHLKANAMKKKSIKKRANVNRDTYRKKRILRHFLLKNKSMTKTQQVHEICRYDSSTDADE